jgi:hypothetical protein
MYVPDADRTFTELATPRAPTAVSSAWIRQRLG